MYSFEGEFRRRPQQSLGGASRAVAREELLRKAQVERSQREEKRRIVQSAISIQAFVRGSFSRLREKRKSRAEFDETLKSSQNVDMLHYQASRLLHFYNEVEDLNRLNFVLQSFLKDSTNITCLCVTQPARWLHKLKQLLLLNVRYLKNCVSPTANISLSLRFVEVFTAGELYASSNQKCMDVKVDLDVNMASKILENIWDFLVRRSYFAVLRLVLENRVPDSLLSSARPPTPLAATLLDLFCRPLTVNSDKKLYFLQILLQDVFTEEFSPQVSCFLLPALSKQENAISIDTLLTAIYRDNLIFSFRTTPYLLYTFMYIINRQSYHLTEQQSAEYLICLQSLLQFLPLRRRGEDGDSDDGEMIVENEMHSHVHEEIINMVNDLSHVNIIVNVLEDERAFNQCVIAICWLCHLLLNHQKVAILNYRLLYTLAFKPTFFRHLWRSIVGMSAPSEYGNAPLLQTISLGVSSVSSIQETLLLQLIVFCSLLNRLLSTLHDIEFYDQNASRVKMMPFTLPEMANISATLKDVCMGLIELAYPDKKSTFNLDAPKGRSSGRHAPEAKQWNQLFRAVVSLLRQLYSRDCRQKFCPEGTWVARQYPVFLDRVADMYFTNRRGHWSRPFVEAPEDAGDPSEEKGPPLSAVEARQLAVLREFPFAIRFRDRYKLFLNLIVKDKQDNQGELANFQLGPQIRITIRRNFIYEDASTSLSYQSEPNIKMRILVQLVNAVGLDEAGIDGGGVFREFLNELLKNCFDPNRGFFKTTNDRLLYPNPNVQRVVPDFARHFYFIGRMLGKAIYENMLVELPLAGFFLAKILSRQTSDVDIHHLASLDPVMYRNLLYLKTYDGDVSDLGLDFTVMNSEFGENEVVELIPGGADVPVTESNRINYIHLMADFKLNRQIKAQCQAFKEGLANVIDMEWLYMFDPNELQVLISGAQTAIDIDDLRSHTTYSGGFSATHPVIRAFWKVVEGFDEMRRRQLLKFVTSCSRGPLLGFKDLSPHFCIQSAGRELRLPTSSTCMNLLKLPEFDSEELLKVKLIYAMEAGAGFELS